MTEKLTNILRAGRQDRRGMTSVVVVLILFILLTLLTIGFTKAVNRSSHNASANQQATAANYAAQSGINDVIAYLKTAAPADPILLNGTTKCDQLLGAAGPLNHSSQLSSDGSTAYTCALVDPTPGNLSYPTIPANESQVVKLIINNPHTLDTLLVSWQAKEESFGDARNFIPATGSQKMFDETKWIANKYEPLLRLAVYPVGDDQKLDDASRAASRTYFLYPQNGADGGPNQITYGTNSGVKPVNCSSVDVHSFVGTRDYKCNVYINGLQAATAGLNGLGAAFYYVRITPYYGSASVALSGNDDTLNPVEFKDAQIVVDVTAKSGSSTKRLQARVKSNLSGGSVDLNVSPDKNILPEYSLRSANTICKRLVVNAGVADLDPGTPAADCGFKPDIPTPANINLTYTEKPMSLCWDQTTFGTNCGAMDCTRIDEPEEPSGGRVTPSAWLNTKLCSATGANYNFTWVNDGNKPAGQYCLRIYEDGDPHGWDNNYLCSPNNYGLRWSHKGALNPAQWACTQWRITTSAGGGPRSPAVDDPVWADNYLCAPQTGASSANGRPVAYAASAVISWDISNADRGCTTSGDWSDAVSEGTNNTTKLKLTKPVYSYTVTCHNHFGSAYDATATLNVPVSPEPPPPSPPAVSLTYSALSIGLQFSDRGPISGMDCTSVNEGADDHGGYTWSDNYLCTPKDSDTPFDFVWDTAGRFPGSAPKSGKKCVQIDENDPGTWDDNYLCADHNYNLCWTYQDSNPAICGGYVCNIPWHEFSDPYYWGDNGLCQQPNNAASGNGIPVPFGYGATINWNVSGANSCSSSGDWSQAIGPAGGGAVNRYNLQSNKNYSITCLNDYYLEGTASTTVPVAPEPPMPPETCGDNRDNNGNGLVDDGCPPEVITDDATNVDKTTATLNGRVNPHNTATTGCGFEWGTDTNYSMGNQGCAPGDNGDTYIPHSFDIGGLTPGTEYHYRFRIASSVAPGLFLGNDKTFRSLDDGGCGDDCDPCPECGGSDPSQLISFTQPDDQTCNERYGAPHYNNCYDYYGINLGTCHGHLEAYNDSSTVGLPYDYDINQGRDGGSYTLGDKPPGSSYLGGDSPSGDSNPECPERIPLGSFNPNPPITPNAPRWVSFGVSYYGHTGLKKVSNGVNREASLPWCIDYSTGHAYLVCGVFVTKNVHNPPGCYVFWATPGNPFFQEKQFDGDTQAASGGGMVLGWPGRPPTNGPLTVSCPTIQPVSYKTWSPSCSWEHNISPPGCTYAPYP